MSGENPHPGDMHHGQNPVGCPTPHPPPPLGLDIDRCINVILPFRVSSKENRVNVDITNLPQNFSFSMIKYTPDKRAKELISRPLFKSNSDSATY